ncbi:MAG: ferredoxin-type protein NapF [Rhodocyclaceae bacterium]|nr:ferredoxin-type protein NapF [Rhodocyclaceae bacterium]
MDAARRGFLRGRPRDIASEFRPPWAGDEHDFIRLCTRCDACIEACPTKLIKAGGGGYPSVDFSRAECTFCGECARVCDSGAIARRQDAAPWGLRARFGAACIAAKGVECRICGESCEAGAVRFRPVLGGISQPEFEIERCTGCGACVAPCPVTAIAMGYPMESGR